MSSEHPLPGPPLAGADPEDQTARPRTSRLGDFELLSKLGQGAMGTIYLARQITQERRVALKILPQNLARDEEFLERFMREARAIIKLRHLNIRAAYEVGVVDGYNYIAMEYVPGPDLETLLAQAGPLGETELLRIAGGVCQALGAAHAQGIVHRDIKPANILLDETGNPKLIDLGLASAADGEKRVTLLGYAVGTPFYISPEQARGKSDVDGRADIYSLGATLYHLATGSPPYPGVNPALVMTRHISEPLQPPDERRREVSPRLSLLIQKMMAKDPNARQQDASELLEDIQRCQRGEMPAVKRWRSEPVSTASIKEPASGRSKPSGSDAAPTAGWLNSITTPIWFAAAAAIFALTLLLVLWLVISYFIGT